MEPGAARLKAFDPRYRAAPSKSYADLKPFYDRHRRRILTCGACVLTLGLIETAVRRGAPILNRYADTTYGRTLAALASADHPDIVIMGSSRAGYALDPEVVERVTGHRTFNSYIPSTKVVEWIVLARRMFAEYRPKLVILGVNASEVRADYRPTEAARHIFEWPDLVESIWMDGCSLDVVGSYCRRAWAPIWATYDKRFELCLWGSEQLVAIFPIQAQSAREQRARAARPFPANGFRHPWMFERQRANFVQRIKAEGPMVHPATCPQFDPDGATLVRFQELLSCLRAKGIRVVVAYIPNSPATELRWIATEPRLMTGLEDICKSQNVAFLQWSLADLPRTDADYIHETHVGLPLARRISGRIAEYIRAQALLHDADGKPARRFAATEADP